MLVLPRISKMVCVVAAVGLAIKLPVYGDDRAAVPDAKACEAATRVVKDAFRYDAVGNDPARQLELAHKLVEAAGTERDSPAIRYVELCRARDIACGVDLDAAFDISDLLAKSFVVDPWQARVEVLTSAKARPTVPAVESIITWSQDALAVNRLDVARRLAEAAVSLAGKMNDPVVSADARDCLKQLTGAEKESRVIDGLRTRLKASPDDTEISLELGRLLCLGQGKWTEGVPLLRNTADARLHAAVAIEIANPSVPAALLAAGDAWWDVAANDRSFPAAAAKRRALLWYRQALPELDGLAKLRVEGRLEDAGHEDFAVTGVSGKWITLAWSGVRWDPSKRQVNAEHGTSSLRLSNADSAKVYFVNDRIFPGDFSMAIIVKGRCLIGLLAADRTDRSVYCTVPDDGKWHEIRMQRQGQTVTALQDGREKEVQAYNAIPRMAGVFGLILEAGRNVDVRSLNIR